MHVPNHSTFAPMIARIASFLLYWLRAKGPNRVHSPFVFSLYTDILLSSKQYYAFAGIEKVRKQLLLSEQEITDPDPGAGSQKPSRKRLVKTIAANSLLSPAQGRLLFKLVDHFKPKIILELGTSLGISTLYLSKAFSTEVQTIEGQASVAAIASRVFKNAHATNIQLHQGLFEETLPQLLPQLKQVDMLYMDGNHTYEATIHYFNLIFPYLHKDTVIILDDIRWSADMMRAWSFLSQHEAVHVSIDLQKIGFLFLRPSQEKEHFILRI